MVVALREFTGWKTSRYCICTYTPATGL